jgi:hypothetical protein
MICTRTLASSLLMGLAAWQTDAGTYRLTFSGGIDTFMDTRSPGSDLFSGTGLAVGAYTPALGDIFSFSIVYDSDTQPQPGSPDAAIYSGFSWSMSLASVQIAGGTSGSVYFYYDNPDQERILEIFGSFDPAPGLGGIAGIEFAVPTPLGGLINDGQLPASADVFDGIGSTDLFFYSSNGDFSVGASQHSVTVEQIPSPGPLCLCAGAASAVVMRRRRA